MRRHALPGASCLLVIGCCSGAVAEEPPLSVPKNGPPRNSDGTINFNGWLLYPTVRAFSVFSDNLYQSPVNPVNVAGVGIAPSLIAKWTNGIHSSTLYGNAEVQQFPSKSFANTFDRQGGVIQKYEAMRDLIFTFQGDYTHKTNTSTLSSSTPEVFTPGVPAKVTIGGTNFKNPSDQFTATGSIYKFFNRAFLKLTGAVSRTEYEDQAISQDFSVKTATVNGGFWFSPWLYAYSDATGAWRSDSRVYRAVAGIGSAPVGLFAGSVYFGHQGSDDNSGTAGGNVYGAKLSYSPTRDWILSLAVDETTNVSNQTVSNTQSLNLGQSPLLVQLGSSTEVTSINLQSDYIVSLQLALMARLNYTRVDYLNSTRLDEAFLATVALNYQIWRNMMLTLDYQYASITSNVPLESSTRHYITVGAMYKF